MRDYNERLKQLLRLIGKIRLCDLLAIGNDYLLIVW